jgi:hypothetical protein
MINYHSAPIPQKSARTSTRGIESERLPTLDDSLICQESEQLSGVILILGFREWKTS